MVNEEVFDLKKVHEANLDILRAVDEICRKHHITYRIDSGTLLGAVRHKGFIPWDDDVDLLFRREEFEAFCKVASELPEKLALVLPDEYQNGKAFYDFVPRVIYKNSRRHANLYHGPISTRAQRRIQERNSILDKAGVSARHC